MSHLSLVEIDLLGLDPLIAVALLRTYHYFLSEGESLLDWVLCWRSTNQLLACNVCLSESRIVWGWFLLLPRLVKVISEMKLGILDQMSVAPFIGLFFPE